MQANAGNTVGGVCSALGTNNLTMTDGTALQLRADTDVTFSGGGLAILSGNITLDAAPVTPGISNQTVSFGLNGLVGTNATLTLKNNYVYGSTISGQITGAISLVKEESVPVAALIIAHLEPKLAARILQALSPEAQREIVPRIAKLQKVDIEVIRRAEKTLRSKVRDIGAPVTEDVDGTATLTEILRYMDPAAEQAILADLEPNTAQQVRKVHFKSGNVARVFRVGEDIGLTPFGIAPPTQRLFLLRSDDYFRRQ